MSRKFENVPVQEARLLAASDWLQRLDQPEVPEADLLTWLKWHGESEENRQAFEHMQRLYRQLRELPTDCRRELREQIGHIPTTPKLNSGKSWALAASLILLVGVAGSALWLARGHETAVAVYTAPQGQHRTVKLSDGSVTVPASDSIISVQYSGATRSLHVERGQAYFEVAHNSRRPFIVQAGPVQVTAVGTEFNVTRSEHQVAVTVTDGVVDVAQLPAMDDNVAASGGGAPVSMERHRLGMGQHLVLRDRTAAATGQQADVNTAWPNGEVQFVEARLQQVIQTVNRYAQRPLVIDDPRVADLTYSGTVFRNHVDEWVESLPAIFPVRTVTLNDGSVALVSRNAQASSR